MDAQSYGTVLNAHLKRMRKSLPKTKGKARFVRVQLHLSPSVDTKRHCEDYQICSYHVGFMLFHVITITTITGLVATEIPLLGHDH